jgi:4-amino-4-deoxy-L-arabinose transferase-like glycosyltransferase
MSYNFKRFLRSRRIVYSVMLIGLALVLLRQPLHFAVPTLLMLIAAALAVGIFMSPRHKATTELRSVMAFASGDASDVYLPDSSSDSLDNNESTLSSPNKPSIATDSNSKLRRIYAFDPAAWPMWLQATALFGALLIAYIGQAQMVRDADRFSLTSALTLLVVGLGAFFIIIWGTVLEQDSNFVPPLRLQAVTLRPVWSILAGGLIVLEALRSVQKPPDAYLGDHLLLWFLAMAAFMIAVSPLQGELDGSDTEPLLKWEYWLLIGLFVAGFAVRFVQIETIPAIMDNDEALFALEGANFIKDHFKITPFEPGIHSHPRLYQAMIGISVSMFGNTLAGARLPSVLLGALTIPAVYLLGRELRDKYAGLIAALFTLTWAYAIQFSRLSMNQPADPLFGTLAFYFLLRGLRRGAASDYALSGFMVGIAQLFYLGGRLIPMVMIAYLLFIWLRDRSVLAQQWRLLLIVPTAALFVSLPQNLYLIWYKLPISTRTNPSILFNGQIGENIARNNLGNFLWNQTYGSFMGLIALPDRSNWYGRSSSLLGLAGGPLFLIGVIVSMLVLWKRPKWSLPLGWSLAVILGGGTLSISPPQYERYFPAVSAFALLVEFGITATALAIANVIRRQRLNRMIAVMLTIVVAIVNLAFYVGVYVPEASYFASKNNWLSNAVGRGAAEAYAMGNQVVMLSGFNMTVRNAIVTQFFMANKPYLATEKPITEIEAKIQQAQPIAFFIAMERAKELPDLITRYPGGTVRTVKLSEDGSDAYILYQVPAITS